MTADQLKRFERWRGILPENTAYFVSRVLEEIVPLFLGQEFGRYPDYAAGSTSAVGANCIPLQRRSGSLWPTVEILFHKRALPSLGVHFAALPEMCWRRIADNTVEIPRLNASVIEGPAFFLLCRGSGRNYDCNFGYRRFAINPTRKLENEVAALKALIPRLISILVTGIPDSWYRQKSGYVDQHVFLSPASKIVLDAVRTHNGS